MYTISPHLKGIYEKQMEERSERKPGPAARPIATVKGNATIDVQFRAQVEGHSFISDERESSGGHDAGPAPMRLFLSGIMFCQQVWMVKKFALMSVSPTKLDGEISWFNDIPTPRIVYKIIVDSKTSDDNIKTVVDAGCQGCSAFQVAEKATHIDVTVVHNGKTILEKAYGLK